MKSCGGDRLCVGAVVKDGIAGWRPNVHGDFPLDSKKQQAVQVRAQKGSKKITTFIRTFELQLESLRSQGVTADVAWILREERGKRNHSAITWSYSDIRWQAGKAL